jgi:hypothetical protein
MSNRRIQLISIFVAVIFLGFVFLFGGSAMTALAAQSALPGDTLYPLKITLEQTRLSLARSAVDRAEIQMEFAQRRLVEIEGLIAEGRYRNIVSATQEFEAYINNALIEADRISASDPEQAAELLRKITDALSRYGHSLTLMLDNIPDPAKTEILRSIETLQNSKGNLTEPGRTDNTNSNVNMNMNEN